MRCTIYDATQIVSETVGNYLCPINKSNFLSRSRFFEDVN